MESIMILLVGGFVGLVISTFNSFFNPIQWTILCGFTTLGIYLVVLCWLYQHIKEDNNDE